MVVYLDCLLVVCIAVALIALFNIIRHHTDEWTVGVNAALLILAVACLILFARSAVVTFQKPTVQVYKVEQFTIPDELQQLEMERDMRCVR